MGDLPYLLGMASGAEIRSSIPLALVGLLDDYVCVSNTNVHLRHALGKDYRVLVAHSPEFRWMAEGGESPWFPGTTVYRQAAAGDWDTALDTIGRDLLNAFPG